MRSTSQNPLVFGRTRAETKKYGYMEYRYERTSAKRACRRRVKEVLRAGRNR
jgi:hypothetical protein